MTTVIKPGMLQESMSLVQALRLVKDRQFSGSGTNGLLVEINCEKWFAFLHLCWFLLPEMHLQTMEGKFFVVIYTYFKKQLVMQLGFLSVISSSIRSALPFFFKFWKRMQCIHFHHVHVLYKLAFPIKIYSTVTSTQWALCYFIGIIASIKQNSMFFISCTEYFRFTTQIFLLRLTATATSHFK